MNETLIELVLNFPIAFQRLALGWDFHQKIPYERQNSNLRKIVERERWTS